MGKGGGGQNTVVQNSQPPAAVLAQYQKVIDQANQVAQTPYTTGGFNASNLVAPFSPMQNQGFNVLGNTVGIQDPYFAQAQTYLSNSQAPIWNNAMQYSPSTMAQFYNPYLDQAVGATRANIEESNAEQQQQLKGNAIASGAWGGDRAGIAQAELARQQALAENQTIANMENTGFAQQQAEFNAQQQAQIGANEANAWLGTQGAALESNLGTTAQAAGINSANALLNAGQQQQQLQQEQLNIPYEQFQAQQAYPFQTTGWLSNISTGVGGSMGGTGTTSSPAPSALSQGLGTAASLGTLGYLGYLGGQAAGWWGVPAAAAAVKRGGRVTGFHPPRRSSGGFVPAYDNGGGIGGSVPGEIPLSSFETATIPTITTPTIGNPNVSRGMGPPKPPNPVTPSDQQNGASGGMGNLAMLMGANKGFTPTLAEKAGTDFDVANAQAAGLGDMVGGPGWAGGAPLVNAAGDSVGPGTSDVAASGIQRFLSSIGFRNGGSVPHYAIGGLTPSTMASNPMAGSQYSQLQNVPTEKLQELAARFGGTPQGRIIQAALQQRMAMPSATTMARGGFVPHYDDGGSIDDTVSPTLALADPSLSAFTPAPNVLPPIAPTASPQSASSPSDNIGFRTPVASPSYAAPNHDEFMKNYNAEVANAEPYYKPDPIAAFLGTMAAIGAGRSPQFGVNAGEGALKGMEDWQKQKQEAAAESARRGSLEEQGESLYNQILQHKDQMNIENERNKIAQEEVDLKGRQKWTIDPNTGMPMNVYTGEMKNPYQGNGTPSAQPPLDKSGNPTSDNPADYFSVMSPQQIVDYRNVVKRNQPKDLQTQQALLTSLVDQKTKVDDLVNQIPVASHGDMHTLQDFADRNKIPGFSDPKRGAASVAAAYDTLGNVLDNVRSTFGGTGRVLQAEFSTLKNELNAAANMSPEQKAVVVSRIKSRLDQITQDQLQYTDDVASGMAYMPSSIYKSPTEKRLRGLVEKSATEGQPVKPLDTLPAGAVQIGTSGGKPVYKLKDGTTVIEQ